MTMIFYDGNADDNDMIEMIMIFYDSNDVYDSNEDDNDIYDSKDDGNDNQSYYEDARDILENSLMIT